MDSYNWLISNTGTIHRSTRTFVDMLYSVRRSPKSVNTTTEVISVLVGVGNA